ncbi:hypothetical protein NECAME_05030 [Necator americanus]|uniref:Uncharacterized protein n=1 Tax=Necator americanus TaxID=51031 RepID=W2SMM7_NECAM|nr:hypothetical protein NECAME_05030 [Necator americanus]ETN69972.1 hypothetical protein NECAME_05030 [Necator americanus]
MIEEGISTSYACGAGKVESAAAEDKKYDEADVGAEFGATSAIRTATEVEQPSPQQFGSTMVAKRPGRQLLMDHLCAEQCLYKLPPNTIIH